MYISHMRSEGNRLVEAVDEVVEIARRGRLPAEIYHLKQAGRANWTKLDKVIERIEQARGEGLAITADMYPYEAGATGLSSCFPVGPRGRASRDAARLREGGCETHRWECRDRVRGENLYERGFPEGIVLVSSERAAQPLRDRRGNDSRRARADPSEVAMDLVLEDESRRLVIFMASAENLRREVGLPWMSFGSDAGSLAPEGVFLLSQPHPRAYGTFARVLGRFVRDERAAPLEDAVHRMTGFPAANLKLDHRGLLRPGFFAEWPLDRPDRGSREYTEPHRTRPA